MTRLVTFPETHDTLSVGDQRLVVDQVVAQVLDVAGPGRVLAVGRGCVVLLRALLDAGFDAVVIDEDLTESPGDRLWRGSMLSLPFSDASFDTVIWTDVKAYSDPAKLTPALKELHRVSRRSVFLRISAYLERERWEALLFNAGFRKHPNCFRVNAYELLEHPSPPITVVAEKLPTPVRDDSSIEPVKDGCDAGRDMLRQTGRESDARLLRYHRAGQYVRPGDSVVDVSCGCGDGLHVLRHNSAASHFLGIDPRACEIDYARANFAGESKNLAFQAGHPLSLLEAMAAASVDVVLGFNALDDRADAVGLLTQCRRILKPGGRILVSARRQVDFSGAVGPATSFDAIRNLLAPIFLLEDLYVQNVDPAGGGRWIRQMPWEDHPAGGGQWWIATAVRDPLSDAIEIAYCETVFANLSAVRPISTDYTQWYINPWILHSMVHVGYRVKSASLLTSLAERLLALSPPNSADYGAALCILVYRLMIIAGTHAGRAALVDRIETYGNVESDNPHVRRWRISLTFALAQLYQKLGETTRALYFYRACAGMDASSFAVHLETKTADSFFQWGWLALNQGDLHEAGIAWEGGSRLGNRLLNRPIDDVLMNPAYPNAFDHGDGMREFVLALESVTKCVNGIHAIRRHAEGRTVDWGAVHHTFRAKGELTARDLREAQAKVATVADQIVESRRDLAVRTEELCSARRDLLSRTGELDAARADLHGRTDELQVARRDLVSRTGELDVARNDLVARTDELQIARQDLISRTEELDAARKDLISRTNELEVLRQDLISRTEVLEAVLKDLASRTEELVVARQDLIGRTDELDVARQELIGRTGELDVARKDLISRTDELVATRQDLIGRTGELDVARKDLISRTDELVIDREGLISRTRELDTARNELFARTQELDTARRDLATRSAELVAARAGLVERAVQLGRRAKFW